MNKASDLFLQGYGTLILAGAAVTLKLALLSLMAAVAIGLLGAVAKLSSNLLLAGTATVYTTLIRAVPDLVLLLLLFYGIQIGLNTLTDLLGWQQFDIDPFAAGVLTLGFIYGAYFTETFRGAFINVPRGQLEAAAAFGMSNWLVFRRIMFPQMMRVALPGMDNNWQVLVKSTALVSIIGLADVVKASQDAGKSSMRLFFFTLVAGAVYLAIATISNGAVWWLKRRYAVGFREPQL
jgi:histidine transport system permease protein